MYKALIFDWGDTVMRDFPDKSGSMADWDFVEWIPHIEDALKLLSPLYVCVIATNAGSSDTALMIQALKRINADKYFKYFFSSKDLGFEKPDIRFFRTISAKINIAPKECIMIGNLYEKDIVGAKTTGMTTIFFNEKKIKSQTLFPLADIEITTMKDLVSGINFLENSH